MIAAYYLATTYPVALGLLGVFLTTAAVMRGYGRRLERETREHGRADRLHP